MTATMKLRICALLTLLLPLTAAAQQEATQDPSAGRLDSIYAAQQAEAELKIRLLEFQAEIENISKGISSRSSDEQLKKSGDLLGALDSKWNVCYPLWQGGIAASPDLLELTANYQQQRQAASDSIEAISSKRQEMRSFEAAEKLMMSQDSAYAAMKQQAEAMSFIEKAAPQLKNLQTREQLLFADIDAAYQTAKQVAASRPELEPRMKAIEDKYVQLKNDSQEIQAAAYKPLMQRIKDYLLGFAAVAVLLMFISMVQSKIKAAREAKKNAKKMKKLLDKEHKYPTI